MRAFKILILALLTALHASAQIPFYLASRDSSGWHPVEVVIQEAENHLGTPYRSAGKTPKGFDCAGFTRYCYSKLGITLAPYAGGQLPQGEEIKNTKQLRRGDLVFWGGRGGGKKNIGHVGIVVEVDTMRGSFRFIHSATTGGIRYDYSEEPYYKKRYVGACRIIPGATWVEPKPFMDQTLPIWKKHEYNIYPN